MKVIILAAGYAVRLEPLTLTTPKPLLPIGGRKLIDRILERLAGTKEIDSIYVVSNHKFFKNFEEWAKSSPHSGKISLIDDGTLTNETRLGAIRDLELSIKTKHINDDLLVIAGDNLFHLDLKDFLKFAKKHGNGVSIALYDVGSLEAAKRFGVVGIDKDRRVVDFEEKPRAPRSALISTGIYYFPKDKVSGIIKYAEHEAANLDAPGYYIKWLSANDKVYGFSFSEKWYDIGDIESYKKADEEYAKKKESKRNGST